MTTTVSTYVNNSTSVERTINSKKVAADTLTEVSDTVTVPDTANADVVITKPIPVNCILKEVVLECGDLGTAGTIDIGFYRRYPDGTYVAVDADCIANNLAVSPAFSYSTVPQRYAGLAADASDKKAWEIASLTSEPSYAEFYIGLTTDTGTTASGTATVTCKYIN